MSSAWEPGMRSIDFNFNNFTFARRPKMLIRATQHSLHQFLENKNKREFRCICIVRKVKGSRAGRNTLWLRRSMPFPQETNSYSLWCAVVGGVLCREPNLLRAAGEGITSYHYVIVSLLLIWIKNKIKKKRKAKPANFFLEPKRNNCEKNTKIFQFFIYINAMQTRRDFASGPTYSSALARTKCAPVCMCV